MATRLIDANELRDTIENEHFGEYDDKETTFYCIDTAPTVDAVPVVRCKDCKHFNFERMECENEAVSTDHEGGASYSLNFYLDDFCSYGERKEKIENESNS